MDINKIILASTGIDKECSIYEYFLLCVKSREAKLICN